MKSALQILCTKAPATLWCAAVLASLNLLELPTAAAAGSEHDFAVAWCDARKGRSEVVLGDRSRVDCLTATHAIEVDWAKKAWTEGIGQALHYAQMTGLTPAVLAIVKQPSDCRFIKRLYSIADRNCPTIDVFETGPWAYKCAVEPTP